MKTKKPLSDKILKYTVIFEPASEGGYIVSVPALPGCVTQGETFEEAMAMAKDAILGYLDVLRDEDICIPTEKAEPVVTQISVSYPVVANC